MGPKVVLSNDTHGNPHPTLYKGNYWDHHFSLLPVFVPLPLFIVPNAHSWKDPILNPKVFYSLLKVYQTLESTHFQEGLGELKKIEKRKWSRGGEKYKEKKSIWKKKCKRFVKTYRKKGSILGQAFCIREGTNELGKLADSVYVCQNEMNAKIRRVIDLRGIYTKERVRSRKIPAWFPTKPSTVGFASHHRTWATESRKNLMKMRLEC